MPGRGPVRTGVTAVVVEQCEAGGILNRIFAGGFVFAGAGEVTGLMQALEWGLIETPIMLSPNTMSVGLVRDAAMACLTRKYPTLGHFIHDPSIPMVAECDDSYPERHAGPARQAGARHLRAGVGGAGAGGGGQRGGRYRHDRLRLRVGVLGTASRRLPAETGGYTVGALIVSNFGERRRLGVLGVPAGLEIADLPTTDHVEGSCAVVVATDAPVGLCTSWRNWPAGPPWAWAGYGDRMPSGSGEVVVAAPPPPPYPVSPPTGRWRRVPGGLAQPAQPSFEAAIEAVEEAVLNSLLMARPMVGRTDNVAHAPACRPPDGGAEEVWTGIGRPSPTRFPGWWP